MKSLIQEAPSIIKAIQQAWDKAGNPVEFSVKVLEREERNFLGMTRKPAVISFFFEPSLLSVKKHPRKKEMSVDQLFEESTKGNQAHQTHQRREHKSEHKQEQKPNNQRPPSRQKQHPEQHHAQTHENDHLPQSHHSQEPRQPRIPLQMKLGTEHVDTVKEWLDEALKIMQLSITYSVKSDAKAITFTFNDKVLDQEEEEGMLFASFAFLLMQGLKKKYRNKFKGFKLILKSPLTVKKAS